VFNDEWFPNFDALKLYNGHDTLIHYSVCDILWLNRYYFRKLPLVQRKEILRNLVAQMITIQFSESFEDGRAL